MELKLNSHHVSRWFGSQSNFRNVWMLMFACRQIFSSVNKKKGKFHCHMNSLLRELPIACTPGITIPFLLFRNFVFWPKFDCHNFEFTIEIYQILDRKILFVPVRKRKKIRNFGLSDRKVHPCVRHGRGGNLRLMMKEKILLRSKRLQNKFPN